MLEVKPIIRIQKEYRMLLAMYEQDIRAKGISDFKLKALFTEVKVFWYRNRSYINFFLNNIKFEDDVAFLAGAVYVDILNDGHKEFSLLGRKRIINDPLSKMSIFFKNDALPINYERIKNYVYTVTVDLLEMLDYYSEDFWIVPLNDINEDDHRRHIKELSSLAESCILAAFENQYSSIEEFLHENSTYEDIEKHVSQHALEYFVYTAVSDSKLSLRERVQKYCMNTMNSDELKKTHREPEIFLMVSTQLIMQCFDIFLTAAEYKIVPFIRNDVVFCYLGLFFNLISQIVDQETLNRTIIAYIAQSRYDFGKIPYQEFIKNTGNNILVNRVLYQLKTMNRLFPTVQLNDIAKLLDTYYTNNDDQVK